MLAKGFKFTTNGFKSTHDDFLIHFFKSIPVAVDPKSFYREVW